MKFTRSLLPATLLLAFAACVLGPADVEAREPARPAVKKHKARVVKQARAQPKKKTAARRAAAPARPPETPDLRASVALVFDPAADRVLYGKNESTVQPIASLTKLMTGVVIEEAGLPLDEEIEISDEDVDRLKFSSSRLPVGTTLSRREALHLALMSSENRAAHALGRTYPGGLSAFVEAMNNKARQLGMKDTHYVEPTGLSSANQSTARDLALLVEAAARQPLVRKFSTSSGYQLDAGSRTLKYGNTNRLVNSKAWDITVQKTGYIREAGQCLLLEAEVAGRRLIMVFLDSAGKLGRIRDAEAVRHWLGARPELLRAKAKP